MDINKKRIYKYSLKRKLTSIKAGAKRRNYIWDISDEYAYKLMQTPCVYCGAYANPFNGIDRVDNTKGYTEDNVVPCCKYCNRAKSDMTVKEFLKHIEEIYEYMEK